MDRDEVFELLRGFNPSAGRDIANYIAAELDGLAAQLWALGLAEGPRRALAIVAQIGGELAIASCLLYESERWYAGAALVRQLIEVEYLMFLFATKLLEPTSWLESSPEEARQQFSPASMRLRSNGRFNAEEYSAHCEMGGHPRLRGSALLREHRTSTPVENDSFVFDPRVQWVDLAQHLERLWTNYARAVTVHSPTNVFPTRFAAIEGRIAAWRSADGLPDQI